MISWIRTFPMNIFPLDFAIQDNSPSLFTRYKTFSSFHHTIRQYNTICNIKRSTVNVYKIDSGRSVRVRSMG